VLTALIKQAHVNLKRLIPQLKQNFSLKQFKFFSNATGNKARMMRSE
jgi:hypothetical protein